MFSGTGVDRLDPRLAEFDNTATARQLKALAKNRRIVQIQCSEPVNDRVWGLLNEHFISARPNVMVRAYGGMSKSIDLKCLKQIPSVRHLSIDRFNDAKGLAAFGELQQLRSLTLGVYNLPDLSVLDLLPASLRSLSIDATRSKKPSLAHIGRFKSLRSLRVEGHSKGIEAVGELKWLESLTLRSITTPNLEFLRGLPKLKDLEIKLGGIRSFTGIEGKASIRYLELWQIRELRTIDVVSTLANLQNLYLQSLPHIKALPSLDGSEVLRRVIVNNLKGLRDFRALATAPALEEFGLLMGSPQTPAQLKPVLANPSVRRVAAHFASDRHRDDFRRLATAAGKADFNVCTQFRYRRA